MNALVLPYEGKVARFGADVFLAPGCKIVGEVHLGDRELDLISRTPSATSTTR